MRRVLAIDLDTPASARWAGLNPNRQAANALLDVYQRDLGSIGERLLSDLVDLARGVLPTETMLELEGVARAIDAPLARVVLGNLYYDLIKSGVACSAFAVDTHAGPLHARNLDWWTTGNLLRDETLVVDCQRKGSTRYRLIGWPGFIGAFSGVAPGRFAITLNAVLSDDAPIVAEPAVFLLRRVLDEAPSFGEALVALRDGPIASDCLLLLTGTEPGAMAVIERTPTRSAVRGPSDGFIEVTNDYRRIDVAATAHGELGASSCQRSQRLHALLSCERPSSADDAFAHLSDGRVKMGITVQQMVLHARSGRCELRRP